MYRYDDEKTAGGWYEQLVGSIYGVDDTTQVASNDRDKEEEDNK